MTGQAGPVLVGYGPEDRGRGGLELARLIAESAGRALLVTCVIPDRWGSVGPGRSVDQDYQDHLHGLARQALAHARDALAECAAPVDYRVITARSAAAGLSQAAQEAQAWLLVAGSSADGAWGHIALGSTSDRMLHSARVPVALASRGQRYPQGGRVARVTAAVDGSDSSATVLAAAAVFSDQLGVPLRVVSFAVRAGTMYPPEVGLHAEDRVVAAWRAQAQEMLARLIAELPPRTSGSAPRCEPQLHVSEGRSWADALEEPGWEPGELLVIGSSASESRMARVFLGSTATRILRHSPVPVVVMPAGATMQR